MASGKGHLRIAIEDFLETFGFGGRIRSWVNETLEQWETEIIRVYDIYITSLGIEEVLPEIFKPSSLKARTNRSQVEIILIIGTVLGTLIAIVSAIPAPFTRKFTYIAERLAKTNRPDVQTLLAIKRRFPQDINTISPFLQDTGFDGYFLDRLNDVSRPLLTGFEYQALWRRGYISETDFVTVLVKMGYEPETIQGFMDLGNVIPAPNDLITMAVREAFDDGVSSRFQHDENFPPEFAEWAAKQGLNADWSKRYWRAHWQLPSPNQVFEMLHRLRPGKSDVTLTQEDVNTFLRTADYAPFWRERLSKISYAPYTRVDVRRMYKTGVLNETQVKDAYLDLGYDDEHAQALTQFTIAFEAEEETGIVRTSVLSAYGDGMIDRGTAEGMLASGGYDATTTAFYLDNVDFREALEITQIKLSSIKKKFIEGLIDETTVNNEINILNLPAQRVTALLELWVTERENQIALPTLAQIENFYELGISTLDDFTRILKRRGYSDETIKWNIQRMDIEKQLRAQKDAEKAEADNERLVKSKTASQYQKDKSEYDLAIAQAKAEITDIDVALHGTLTDDEIATLKARKDELKLFISQINVAKAQLRFDTQSTLDKLIG